MGRPDGFMLYGRSENTMRDISERIQDYEEIKTGLSCEERRTQASRCMNCGVPFCQSGMILNKMAVGCPLHNLIPEWNDHIYLGNDAHALKRLLKTNPFPEFTGRVCPALCEKACISGLDAQPVTIHDNELWLIEYGFENNLMKPEVPPVRSGKKAAVVGSGPAGLSCAWTLNRRGHEVTVFERDDEIGGLLMYGIPNMKLDKKIIRRRRKLMEEEGVTFVTDTEIGKDIDLDQLRQDFDTVILACGAKKERMPAVAGIEETPGVIRAVEFLKQTTKALPQLPEVNAKGKHAVVLGGGDTGNDCVGTCIRQGCASVVQLEMMRKPPLERGEDNPWPQYPLTLKTDYGQLEAIHVFGSDPRMFSTTLTGLFSDENGLKEIETAAVSFKDGKMILSEQRERIPCDLLIIAAGFTGCEPELPLSAGIELTARGTVATPEGGYATSEQGIFACGDMRKGQSLVVWAIAEGRRCAREADAWLMGYTNLI